MTTMDIELIGAVMNAPTGLDGRAADTADPAGGEPTNDRLGHPSNPADAHATRAAQYRRPPRDVRDIIERVNSLAGKWEQGGRLGIATKDRLRSAFRIGSPPASVHTTGAPEAGAERHPMGYLVSQDLSAAGGLPGPELRHDAMSRPMGDRTADGSSGDGFTSHVGRPDLFVGLTQLSNGCRSGFPRG
jgi:hypothetical protein